MTTKYEAFAVREWKKVLIWDKDNKAYDMAQSYLTTCDLAQYDESVIPEADEKINMDYDLFIEMTFDGKDPFLTDIDWDDVNIADVKPFGLTYVEYEKLLVFIMNN